MSPDPTTDTSEDPTALVVGATGIAGAALCARLVDAGWTVLGLSRSGRDLPGLEQVRTVRADLTDASERIWDVLENFMEIVNGLESTNESVLSHRLNDGLRVLTAVSVILLPLTLVASVFGMNVHFPGEGSPVAFWIILLVMVAILGGMVLFFRRRGWL